MSVERNFWSKVQTKNPSECWPWTASKSGQGYGRFRFRGKVENAQRVAYELTYGTIDPDKDCCHHCDNPECCNPEHLFMGTRSENMKDSFSKGRRSNFGEKNPNNKLTERQVIQIRKDVSDKRHTMAEIARKLGVDHECIRMIVHRIKWKHI